MKKISLLLVDDQKLFVQNLKIVLESRMQEAKVVGIAYDGEEAVRIVEDRHPQIVLMDVRMPGMDGVEATRVILEKHPETRIVMLTTFDDDEYVHSALQYGAAGYLLKNIPPEDLFAAIRAVDTGSVLIAPSVAKKVISPDAHPVLDEVSLDGREEKLRELIRSLTDREKELVRLIAQAYSNREIAERLFIAEQTVKNYLSVVYMKMGVSKRTELMRLFQEFHVEEILS